MGKTYRSFSYSFFRCPRGRKRALIAFEDGIIKRRRAIPPDGWDDISYNLEHDIPRRSAKHMKEKGMCREYVNQKLVCRFRLSYAEANKITRLVYCLY